MVTNEHTPATLLTMVEETLFTVADETLLTVVGETLLSVVGDNEKRAFPVNGDESVARQRFGLLMMFLVLISVLRACM